MHYGAFAFRVNPAYPPSETKEGFALHGIELLISLHSFTSFFETTFSRVYKRLLSTGLAPKPYIPPAAASPPARLFP